MTKRIVWNFELDFENPLVLEQLPKEEKESIRWESRFFWPDDKIITLQSLNNSLLKLSEYTVKPHADVYYLLPDCNANIKMRRDTLFYKPLLKQVDDIYGFGKKIPLEGQLGKMLFDDNSVIDLRQLKSKAEEKGQRLEVTKDSLSYKFPTEPTIKLELARFEIKGAVYFSACIEGRSLPLVQTISRRVLKGQKSCDYVNFLKTIVKP